MDVVRGEWSFAFRVHGFGVYSGQVAPGSILFKVYTTFGCRGSVELICVTRSDTFWGGAGAPPDKPTQGLQKPFITSYASIPHKKLQIAVICPGRDPSQGTPKPQGSIYIYIYIYIHIHIYIFTHDRGRIKS